MKPADRRLRGTGRKESGSFSLIPHMIQDSPNWKACSGTAVKLLCELVRQFNGRNNGDLCAARSVLATRGWRSPDTLDRALQELLHLGFITLARQGGRNLANLYALTWHPIDECGGKLDCAPTKVATGDWKHPKPPFKRRPKIKNSSTESVATNYVIRTSRNSEAA